MAFQIKIKPISKWIGTETKDAVRSQFRNTYSDTKKILEYELYKLNAIDSSVELEMFVHRNQVRADGNLRADAKPDKPGVILSFSIIARRLRNNQTGAIRNETKTLSYPCDRYDEWQDNLRAIALSLEKLRAVSRYGVFKYEDMISRLALPSAEGRISDKDAAMMFIAEHSGHQMETVSINGDTLKQAYRIAAHNLHPDKNGDKTTEDFHRLQDAKRILGI